jgi:formylglycine-generating enzyme required for sulfatase activity
MGTAGARTNSLTLTWMEGVAGVDTARGGDMGDKSDIRQAWALTLFIFGGFIGGTSPGLAEEVPWNACLTQMVRIQWRELIPAIPGVDGLHPGEMVQIARVENLTDRGVTLRLRLRYRGQYMAVGSALGREARERRMVDEHVDGLVTLAPREVAEHYPIDLPNIFRPSPEPEMVIGWDFRPEIIPTGSSCTVLTIAAPPPSAGGPAQVTPSTQESLARSHEAPRTLPEPGSRDDGAPMVLVPAGEFTMGSDQGEDDEKPTHQVHLDAFYMDKFEVTVELYAKFLKATGIDAPRRWDLINQPPHQKLPVVSISWSNADTYCRWVGKRLPTEAEWEKAARGTDGRLYPWGNDSPNPRRANYGKSKESFHQALVLVGTLHDGQSPYGIYELAGNVWEWTSDWYDKNYYQNGPARNPKGPLSGESKVLRGGSWLEGPQILRSVNRENLKPKSWYYIGFRCAKTP